MPSTEVLQGQNYPRDCEILEKLDVRELLSIYFWLHQDVPCEAWASLWLWHTLQAHKLCSCSKWVVALMLCGILVPPSECIKPVSPSLEGRFLTTGPLGKFQNFSDNFSCLYLAILSIRTSSFFIVHKFSFSSGSNKQVLKTNSWRCLFFFHTQSPKLTKAFRYFNEDESAIVMGEARGWDPGIR